MTTVLLAALAMAVAVWLLMSDGSDRLAGIDGRAGERANDATWMTLLSRLRVGASRRRHAAAGRRRVVDALAALAAELRAGQTPHTAIVNAAGSPPAWPRAAHAAQHHGDIASALDADATADPALRALAACWRLAEHSGSGLADAVDRLASAGRAAEAVRSELEMQLAAPRASARTLALLPVVGIGLGFVMGVNPLTWLLGGPAGITSLVAAIALVAVGLWWTGRIAAKVEDRL